MKTQDSRINNLPHTANCHRGGPDIYTELENAMSEAGFSHQEYTIERTVPSDKEKIKTAVLSGRVRYSDPPFYVYLVD